MPTRTKKFLVLVGVFLGLGLFLTACASKASPTVCPLCPPPVAPPTCPAAATVITSATPAPCPTAAPGVEAPFADLWQASAHALKSAPAFTHWDTASPAEIPATCARCHSTPGFQDYVGADGSTPFKVDNSAPIGTVITCKACHNTATANLTTATFPSGVTISNLGLESVCITCHQGRSSGSAVDTAIKAAKFADDDTPATPDMKIGAVTNHYLFAAATRYGTLVKGGYEYAGQSYDTSFDHVIGMQSCVDCHNPHSLAVQIDKCQACHKGVTTVADLRNIRMNDSLVDYNGNGNVKEGIAAELDGLNAMLYQALQAYAKEVAQAPIVYDAATYPYFFIDTNGDGKASTDELAATNGYTAWTGRMLKAAYNLFFTTKDPGAYAHGAKYDIELAYDSIADLNSKLSKGAQVDLTHANRTGAAHFDGAAAAFRNWDAAGSVPATCAKCHAGTGLPQFLANGANIANAPTNTMLCSTCHDDLTKFTRYQVKTVAFPSGANLTFKQNLDSNLCISCHQGRQSTSGVNAAIAKAALANDDTPSKTLARQDIHHAPVGATFFGTQAKGWYEYSGKTYAGMFAHPGQGMEGCADCHDVHTQQPKLEACKGCHNVEDVDNITAKGDTQPLAVTFDNMQARLLEGIMAYAKDVAKTPIVFSPDSYPYWFIDINGNGKADPDETVAANAYNAFTPRLVKAVYNYQASFNDPGAFIHNHTYVFQVLYDTISDLQSKVPSLKIDDLTRPENPAPAK